MRGWVAPVSIAAVVALATAMVGGTLTDLGPWYQGLVKPAWTPPGPVFPIAWTTIFTLCAVAGVAAWRATTSSKQGETVIGLFALNGFLNIGWSLLFFRLQRPDWAFYELVALWLSILALVIYCGRLSRLSGTLLLPYLAWVTIAGLLNWQVVQLNAPFG